MTPEAQRIEDIAAALAAYENATTLTERTAGFILCERLKNRAALNHRIAESDAIHLEMVRIGKDTRVVDAMDAASPFSKANWAKAKAASNSPATQTEAA